jgi:hypothetical protein
MIFLSAENVPGNLTPNPNLVKSSGAFSREKRNPESLAQKAPS